MKKRVAVAAMVLVRLHAYGADTTGLVDQPQVIAAMKHAWAQTVNGSIGTEGSYRLDGSPSAYEVVPSAFTGEFMQQKLRLIPGKTFAIFHVHPSRGAPQPSPQDKALARKYHVVIVTIHSHGLFAYDPDSQRVTKVKDGLEWLEPARVTLSAKLEHRP